MIGCQREQETAIARFGRALVSDGYVDDVARLADGVAPELIRRFARDTAGTAPPGWLAGDRLTRVALLLRGEPVAVEAARSALGSAFQVLLRSGLLAAEDGLVRSDRYMIVPACGRPFVVSRLRHDRSELGSIAVYFGQDTLQLARAGLELPGTSVLDLGCGAGIVGQLVALADRTRAVTSVDVCHEAVEAARFNRALNLVDCEILEGDLYAPVRGRRFDLVLADPPAIPMPETLRSPVYGSGGATGDALLRRIVVGSEDVLRPGGRLVAITELQCPTGQAPFIGWIRRWTQAAPGRQAIVTVLGTRELPRDYYRQLGANLGYVPGGDRLAGSPDESRDLLDAFAATARLKLGHWVRVTVKVASDQPSSYATLRNPSRPGAGRADIASGDDVLDLLDSLLQLDAVDIGAR